MDPVTAAIAAAAAALAAGALKGVAKVGENALVDAYEAFKGLLRKKFGAESQVAEAVKEVEARPSLQGPKGKLQDAVAEVKADQDPEVRAAAEALLEEVKKQPGGEQIVQQAIGSYIAQASGGSTAKVNVGQAGPQKP